jgi:hypothetical protein
LDLGDDKLQDIVLESPAGQRRRIDVETGFTVFEVKRDLRTGKVRQDAVIQLTGYVASRAEAMQQRYVGVLTDGAEWHLYSLAGDELARRAGGTYRAPQRQGAAVAKSAGSRGMPAPAGVPAPPRPVLDLMAETFSDPMAREPARTYRYGLDGGARAWVPPLPGLVRESQSRPDPRQRESARAALQKSAASPEQKASGSVRMLAWGTGPQGGAGWQAPQPVTPGLQIAVPGTAGR